MIDEGEKRDAWTRQTWKHFEWRNAEKGKIRMKGVTALLDKIKTILDRSISR